MPEADISQVLNWMTGGADTVLIVLAIKVWRKIDLWKASVDKALEQVDRNTKEIKRIKEVLVRYIDKGDKDEAARPDNVRVPVR